MNLLYKSLSLFIFLCMFSCKENKNERETTSTISSISSDLAIDHFNIWVKNPVKAKKRLTDIGFTSVPDSLSMVHQGQGTTGRYFYFLNGYLELIFIYDQNEFEANIEKNDALDFAERANFENNGASPFSIALKVKDYEVDKIPFEKIKYQQEWMENDASIYAAKNSKTHLKEPSIFVVYPQIESDVFESYADLKKIPEEYALWREFFKHPNGAKKVTDIIISSPDIKLTTKTVQAINGIDNATVKKGPEHLMEVYFDEHIQGKSFDLRPELPLIIYL